MSDLEKHSGGCACGKVRFHSIGKPVRTGLCHCRYCQLRTGTAFGISVYFKKENLIIESGNLKKSNFFKKLLVVIVVAAILFFLATSGKFILPQLFQIVKMALPLLTKLIGI